MVMYGPPAPSFTQPAMLAGTSSSPDCRNCLVGGAASRACCKLFPSNLVIVAWSCFGRQTTRQIASFRKYFRRILGAPLFMLALTLGRQYLLNTDTVDQMISRDSARAPWPTDACSEFDIKRKRFHIGCDGVTDPRVRMRRFTTRDTPSWPMS